MDRAFYDRVARRLRAALVSSGRTQADAALRAGCSQGSLSRFLSRRQLSLRSDALLRLALELGVSTDALVPRRPRRRA